MRCARFPYDRLLTNPVLRADYRTHPRRHERFQARRTREPAPAGAPDVTLLGATCPGVPDLGGPVAARGAGRPQRPVGLAGEEALRVPAEFIVSCNSI